MIAVFKKLIKGDKSLSDSQATAIFKNRHAKGWYLAIIPFFGFFLSIYLVAYFKNNPVLSSIGFGLGWIQGLAVYFYVAILYRCPRCGTVPTSSAKGTTGVLLFPKKCSKCHAPLLPEHKWRQD